MGKLSSAYAVVWCWGLALALLFLVSSCGLAHAKNIPDELAVRCIVGEAANQGEIGMYAVASGLLNRGTTKGVYGCKNKQADKEPLWVWKQARVALLKAKEKRLHLGNHWEAIHKYGKPYWADGMKLVYHYRDHYFYKDIR